MNWFGFGFNGFGQILASEKTVGGETVDDVKLIIPKNINVKNRVQQESNNVANVSCQQTNVGNISNNNSHIIRASWSRRASVHLEKGNGRVCLSGFGAGVPGECCGGDTAEGLGCSDARISEGHLSLAEGLGCSDARISEGHLSLAEGLGCSDAGISEGHLSLAFPDRVECWNLEHGDKKTLAFSTEIKTPSEESGPSLALPLVPGGYIALKPPLYRPLSPQLKAASLALGAEHAILLSATGAVYSWGNGSHGQLGHGGLCAEEEPRALEALLGVPIRCVAAGGWHSACISAWGDLYMWGWNESGQLGLPSRGLKREQRGASQPTTDSGTSTGDETQQGGEEVFISIQAFPALVDVTESCDVSRISCGSRHTAAVTATGDLYTWGWGEYGQLGHGTTASWDEPRRVEFFQNQNPGLRVADVVCGAWNTFASAAAAVQKEATPP